MAKNPQDIAAFDPPHNKSGISRAALAEALLRKKPGY